MRLLASARQPRSIVRRLILLALLLVTVGGPATFAASPRGGSALYLPAIFNNRAFGMTDGFQFANYGGTGYQNLTPVEMQRLYGSQVCATILNDVCTLTPPAERWMAWVNSTMVYGHCEGMAVLSILFQRGIVNPADFGAARTRDLVLEGNEKLQREIAYWYATMVVSPGRAARIIAPPRDLITVLRTAFGD